MKGKPWSKAQRRNYNKTMAMKKKKSKVRVAQPTLEDFGLDEALNPKTLTAGQIVQLIGMCYQSYENNGEDIPDLMRRINKWYQSL